MGRFYKPTRLEYVDYMYKLPADMMIDAVTKIDQNIDNTKKEIEDIRKLSTSTTQTPSKKSGATGGISGGGINVMPQHQERMDTLMSGYNSQIDNLATELSDDPLSYKTMGGRIGDVRTSFEKDITTGEIAGMTGQYASTQAWKKEQLDNDIDLTYVNQVLGIESESWDGGNYKEGNFDPLNLPTLKQSNLKDISEKSAKVLKNSDYTDGQRLNLIAKDIGMDKDAKTTIYQGIKYGQYGTYTDEQGNDIAYEYMTDGRHPRQSDPAGIRTDNAGPGSVPQHPGWKPGGRRFC